jgi:hypothetical protein
MNAEALTKQAKETSFKKVTHTIDKEILDNFNKYCKDNKITKSRLIQAFMKDYVNSQNK